MNTGAIFVIRRMLENGKACARTECAAGHITVLSDESGKCLAAYEAAFAGTDSSAKISFELNQTAVGRDRLYTVGFSDSFSEGIRIPEFLVAAGFTTDEVPALLQEYDLEKFTYMPCSHLQQIQSRQLLMLAALRSAAPVLIFNDPFLPFSGRWREGFAKLLLAECVDKGKTLVCTNLSFLPTCWAQSTVISTVDVSWTEENAVREYRGEIDRQRKEMERQLKKQAEKEESIPLSGKKPAFELPENFVFAYKEVCDRVFAPMEEAARFLRNYSGLVVLGCFTTLVALMGFVMFPNMGAYREKLRVMAEKYEYASLATVLQGSATPAAVSVPPDTTEPAALISAEDPLDETVAEVEPVPLEDDPGCSIADDSDSCSFRFVLEEHGIEQLALAVSLGEPGNEPITEDLSRTVCVDIPITELAAAEPPTQIEESAGG